MTLSVNPHDSLPVFRVAAGDIGILAVTTIDPTTGAAAAGAISINQVFYAGKIYTVQSALLDPTTDPHTLVAAQGANTAIVCFKLFATNSGSGDIVFVMDDGDATALTPEITVGSNGGGGSMNIMFVVTTNKALNVDTISGTTADLGIMCNYIVAAV